MTKKEHIEALVEEKISETEIFLVNITVSKGNRIRIFIDKEVGITIDECKSMSRFIESSLDREKEDFELEVSSPGLDQPFIVLQQYKKYAGKAVKVLKNEGLSVSGLMKEVDDEGLVIEETIKGSKKKKTKDVIQSVRINYDDIKETKLKIQFK